MKLKNKVLLEILGKEHVTRKYLIERLKIAKSALSYVINDLKREGKIEVRSRIKGRGRPEEIISISSNSWRSIGVKIGREAVVGVLMDASLKDLKTISLEVSHDLRNEGGYKLLLKKILNFFKEDSATVIGMSVSGVIENGKVLDSPMLNLKDTSFNDELSTFSMAKVIGDVEALAMYEAMKYGSENFLVINYGLGIGAGVFNGEFRNLPIGHIIVEKNGESAIVEREDASKR
jgi:predicted NBD/HSP70 family sugar kinase